MGKTKYICVTANSAEEFQDKLNKIDEENDVFATQTHAMHPDYTYTYMAVCFCRR